MKGILRIINETRAKKRYAYYICKNLSDNLLKRAGHYSRRIFI